MPYPKQENKPKRIPRPKGTTELSNQYHQGNITLDDIHNHIITHYINTDYRLNGIKLNLEQFTMITNIPIAKVYPYILQSQQLQYNFLDDQDKQRLYGELLNSILNWSLKDRLAVEQHVATLLSSQGNSYKPFISGEVTKALKLMLDSNASMLQVHQRFFGQNAPTITINNTQVQNSLSVSDAHMMIQSNQDIKPLLEDSEARQQLYLKHNLDTVPEINANLQQGIDTSREGLNFNKVIMDSNMVEKEGHIDRRAEELEIDLEQDSI